jgi:predicted signal transduction protein with EAL and GGDEF domain
VLRPPVRITTDLEVLPSASVGVASTVQVGRDAARLLEAADEAMYARKRRRASRPLTVRPVPVPGPAPG